MGATGSPTGPLNCWNQSEQRYMLSRKQILVQVPSESHLVQFCAGDDPVLIRNLSIYLSEAIQRGDALLVVTTRKRTEALRFQMGATGQSAMRQGNLVFCDSHAMLARIMVDGQPDEDRFDRMVGDPVREACAREDRAELSAFGDMVGILWEAGQFSAAVRLEKFWNKLMKRFGFNLFCAYPIDVFSKEFRIDLLDELMCSHTHVVPSETNEDLEAAVNRGMDEILGSRADEMRRLMTSNFRPSWAPVPRAEAMILWLRSNLRDEADEILARAKRYYAPAFEATLGAA
jgi:hypothetical protein